MSATAALIGLEELRPAAAAVLAPVEDTDPYVFTDRVDSLEPPALVIEWDDPWLEAGVGLTTMGPCLYTARLQITCVAGRLDPGSGIDVLDQLVAYVLRRMRSDPYRWPLDRVSAPLQRDLAGVTYLAADVVYAVPVSV
jgi:hypothetical protein